MSFEFDLATNQTLTPVTPLVSGVEALLWESEEVSQGGSHHYLKVNVNYSNMLPADTGQQKFVAIIMQKQNDGTFEEIGRQNVALVLSEQGLSREIVVNPRISKEEGIDNVIAGMEGEPIKLKSFFNDEATGTLKVCIYVKDNDAGGQNAFQSIDITVNGVRYDG